MSARNVTTVYYNSITKSPARGYFHIAVAWMKVEPAEWLREVLILIAMTNILFMSSFKGRLKIEETIKKNSKKPQKRIVHKEPFFLLLGLKQYIVRSLQIQAKISKLEYVGKGFQHSLLQRHHSISSSWVFIWQSHGWKLNQQSDRVKSSY